MNHKKTSINQPKNWKSISNRSQGNVSIYLSPSFPSVVSPKNSWNSLRWSLLVLWKHRKNRYLGVWRVQRPSPQPNSNPSRPPKCPKVLAANLLKDGGLAIYLKLGRRKVEKLVKLVEDSSQSLRLKGTIWMLFFSICWFILLQRLAVSWRSLEFQISFSQIRFPQGRKQGSTLMPMEKTRRKVWILWLRLGLKESSWLSL